MASKRRKRLLADTPDTVDLNVMPFIDIFSLLCTFLLFSAVFVSIGVLEVQIPFLTNAAAPTTNEKPKRSLSIKVDVGKQTMTVATSWSQAPIDKRRKSFETSDSGIQDMHGYLVSLKLEDPDADKVTVFVEDDVKYNFLVRVLDAIKLRSISKKSLEAVASLDESTEELLFPKVIMGSVIL